MVNAERIMFPNFSYTIIWLFIITEQAHNLQVNQYTDRWSALRYHTRSLYHGKGRAAGAEGGKDRKQKVGTMHRRFL